MLFKDSMACDNRTRLYYSGSALSVGVVVVRGAQISTVVRTKAVSPSAADSDVQTKENRDWALRETKVCDIGCDWCWIDVNTDRGKGKGRVT